ncbi:hypothetical protein EMIHUDRAFT_240536 [Emiliania huxleyi CCMP1516]|uniref:Uncharacterized protein n=2 Tax=Emiliania huxleyi TaxID=2903 RepID=A0A0D3JF22_EMIH1|nr:hypothetical protein EMIHUDRAFT_240536 [Emiliania huxleyi CCMP1516]EOD22107.1 hypothetical protein EMIHUDRAFT_240536 [Emiliania huxleyi CCMP1516]|eukprot:XP_005774536.1 hypothetical protein EMIHUDRAFT_240536 [Emiliania huxleyi CCMP1516]
MRRPAAREEGRAAPSVRRAVAPPLAEPRHAIAIGVAMDACWRGSGRRARPPCRRVASQACPPSRCEPLARETASAACAAGEAVAAFGSLLGIRRVSAVVLPTRCVGWRRETSAVPLRRGALDAVHCATRGRSVRAHPLGRFPALRHAWALRQALDGLRKGGRMGYAEPLHLAACAAGEAAAAFGSLLRIRRVSAVVLPTRCVGWRRETSAVPLRRVGAAVLTRRCVAAVARSTPCVE